MLNKQATPIKALNIIWQAITIENNLPGITGSAGTIGHTGVR